MTTTLNFGVLGRCGCGALGRRRVAFADEPICSTCVKGKRGYLRIEANAAHAMTVGRLTPAQRKARIAWLAGSFVREAKLQEIIDDQMEAPDGLALHGASVARNAL